MKKSIEFIRNFLENNAIFIKEFVMPLLYLVAMILICAYMWSCRKDNPPVKPKFDTTATVKPDQIDSIREEINQKKTDYIFQKIKKLKNEKAI